jgi:Domain of unknown function (DUF6438)
MRTAMWISAGALLLSAAACRSQNVATVGTASTEAEPAVRLERGACYGRCAQYVVEVFANGIVRFEGRANLRFVGNAIDTIPPAAVTELMRQFAKAKFATADSAYIGGSPNCGEFFADGPQTSLSATINGRRTAVRYDAGCTGAPPFLRTLAQQVDSVAQTKQWITETGESIR